MNFHPGLRAVSANLRFLMGCCALFALPATGALANELHRVPLPNFLDHKFASFDAFVSLFRQESARLSLACTVLFPNLVYFSWCSQASDVKAGGRAL